MTDLERKKAELETLCDEYVHHMSKVIETFAVIAERLRALAKFGPAGMQVGLDVMPRILKIQKEYTQVLQVGISDKPAN